MGKQRKIIRNKSNISTETQEQRKTKVYSRNIYTSLWKGQKPIGLASHSNPLKVSTWHILYSGVDVANIWWYFVCSANEKRINKKE